MQNPLGKKSALSAAKVFERTVILKAIKELQILKLVYAILEETVQRVYWSSTYTIKVILLWIESGVIELIFSLITCVFGFY